MATNARRRRPRVRRNAQADAAPISDSYRRIRAAIALGLFLMVFGLLWLVNGEFTAQYTSAAFHVPPSYGWAWHILISALELASIFVAPFLAGLPRWFGPLLLLLSLPFGVYDVLSSASGMETYMLWTGVAPPASYGQNTLLAEVVAFLPERMIWFLLVAMGAVLRS
jgi:hypothetical protein